MLSVHSQLLSSSNSKLPTPGAKWSKMSIFHPLDKYNDLSLKLNPTHQHESKVCSVSKTEPPGIKKLKFHANRYNNAYPEKTWFSTKAHLPNLRPQLDSEHQNESGNGLRFWFWVPVGPAHKMMQTLTSNFYSLSRKMWLFTNNTKHRKIIYHWKAFFFTSIQDCYLKIRLYLARIHLQSLWLHGNMCQLSGHHCQRQCLNCRETGVYHFGPL